MRPGRTQQVLTARWRAGALRREPDELIVEEPLAIHVDGVLMATTMRTPGHDFELAVGWCRSEGVLDDEPPRRVRYCATGSAVDTEFNVVTVDTGLPPEATTPSPTPRLGTAGSSCGLCGHVAIDDLCARLAPLAAEPFPLDVLVDGPDAMRRCQDLFDKTGAVHAAAALAKDGTIVVVREDIGRHNAVDKVVGKLLLDRRLPANEFALVVSGRASFEMVQKAWAGGFSAVVAVSAPSALAVDVARAANLTLAGFARDGTMNVYVESENR